MSAALQRADWEALQVAFLFHDIGEPMLAAIASKATVIVLGEGDFLFQQASPAERFFLVVAGRIGLLHTNASGDEKVIEIIGPGQTFAEALMFLGAARYPVGARALGVSRLISFDSAHFLAQLHASTELCFRLMANLSMRLHRLLGEVEALSQQSAVARIVNFLLAQVPEGAVSPVSIALPAPKNVVASRLSIKPETLSRLLHDLVAARIIRVDGPLIEIFDLKALSLFSAS